MVKNKKIAVISSFIVGTTLFVSTALADIATKTGYEEFKDAVKLTAEVTIEKYNNYTTEFNLRIKDNDKDMITSFTKTKDSKEVKEIKGFLQYSNGKKIESYNYNDPKETINYDEINDIYRVFNFPENKEKVIYNPHNLNPFKDPKFNDVERIIDAAVGNLKEHVNVSKKSDGSKTISGSLNETHIQPLINALSSFAFKNIVELQESRYGNEQEMKLPKLTSDMFIKNVIGKADVNKNGAINSMNVSGVLSGKDKDGKLHDITLEVSTKLYDVNSTKFSKPDLTGKKVEKVEAKNSNDIVSFKNRIGNYKNDIVIKKDNKFVKIGERNVKIAHVDDNYVSGMYYETYKQSYESYANKKTEFDFDAQIEKDNGNIDMAKFNFITSDGKKHEGDINCQEDNGSSIRFNTMLQNNEINYNSEFERVFD